MKSMVLGWPNRKYSKICVRAVLLLALFIYGDPVHFGHAEEQTNPIPSESALPSPTPSPDGSTPSTPKVKLQRTSKNSQGCIVDEQAVEDLHTKRNELIEQEKKIAALQAELQARERALEERIKRIEEIRSDIKKTQDLSSKENEEKITKLVETFEAMSPKSIASLIAKLDEQLAVAAMSRMSTPKLAKLLSALEATKSSRLSELLAGVTSAKNLRELKDASPNLKKKGGEKNDDANSEQTNSESTGSSAGGGPRS